MKRERYFSNNGWLKPKYLWDLRQQITLGSLFISDYNNDFGIDPKKVCDFFTSFWDSYCEELAEEDGVRKQAEKITDKTMKKHPKYCRRSVYDDAYYRLCVKKYDNEETLLNWYGCFDNSCDNPLGPNYVNVEIRQHLVATVKVIANSNYEAEEIAKEMVDCGALSIDDFEPCDDCDYEAYY